MSYALAGALQTAVFAALSGDVTLTGLVGGVYDAEPDGAPDLYVAIGPERVTDISGVASVGAAHEFDVAVVTTRDGFADAKAAAQRASEVLTESLPVLATGRLVSLTFKQAVARRDRRDGTRRVELTFRARTQL